MTRNSLPSPARRRVNSLLALGCISPALAAEQQDSQSMPPQLTIDPIGIIETPFRAAAGTPIQPSRAGGARGKVRIHPRYHGGLKDLAGFERIWLVYWFHLAPPHNLLVTPFLDSTPHGIFATRAPARPSPLGISAVQLLGIDGGVLDVAGIDIIDGTPLLDIKPYVPEFDCYAGSRAGWFDESKSRRRLADERFATPADKPPEPRP